MIISNELKDISVSCSACFYHFPIFNIASFEVTLTAGTTSASLYHGLENLKPDYHTWVYSTSGYPAVWTTKGNTDCEITTVDENYVTIKNASGSTKTFFVRFEIYQ